MLLAVALAGCRESPPAGFDGPPSPALWEISTEGETRGWLFGTIHALPGGVEWRSEELDSALAQAEILVVELAGLDDPRGRSRTFTQLAVSGEQPLLKDRVPPGEREALLSLMDRGGFSQGHFHRTETWAAALTLAQAVRESESANGVDRSLLENYPAGRVIELEGALAQLSIFDRLPEQDQRDLLSAVVADAGLASADPNRLARLWFAGDMEAIAAEQQRGILADPELRAALFTSRNRAWTERIAPLLETDDKPFIAVGAAHLPGPEGLAALLQRRGYTLRRLQ